MRTGLKASAVAGPVAALIAAVVAGCDRKAANAPAGATTPATLATAPGNSGWFTDATAAMKLRFTHVAGTNWFMADQVGSGIVIQDFDNDGHADLYFVQNGGTNSAARNALYRHLADGTFADASAGSGTDLAGRGMGAIAGDVNNDGLADLVVTEYGAVHLLLNTGGLRFKDVTRTAGIDNPRWAVPASFIDFDRDGRLDLVVGNYLDYDPTQVCHDVQGNRDFCSPEAFPPTATRLWRNLTPAPGAEPVFEDVTERTGLTRAPGAALGLVCADFTGDGWPDIFCADDGRPNRLFVNQRNGTFRDEAAMRGLAFNAMGRTAANMGVSFADFDGDGRGDVFVTHLTEEFHSLFRQDQAGLFIDAVAQAGLQQQAWRGTGFGTVAADFDGDGAPDIAIANGLVSRLNLPQSPPAPGLHPWWHLYAQKAQLFRNGGSGRFTDISSPNPALSGDAMVGRSLAVGDLNEDGAPDLIVGTIAGPARLLQNAVPKRGVGITLRLVDPKAGGRDAIGAEAVLVAAGRRQWAVLQPATSYLAHHEPVLHFGLGAATSIESVAVLWPDGSREAFAGVKPGSKHTLRKGDGTRQP